MQCLGVSRAAGSLELSSDRLLRLATASSSPLLLPRRGLHASRPTLKFVTWSKAGPDSFWQAIHSRDKVAELFARKAVEEDRVWNARGVSKDLYKQLMKYRWADDPNFPRIDKEEWTIRRGDIVQVVEGEDAGLQGRVIEVFFEGMKVKVEGARRKREEGHDPSGGGQIVQYNEDWIPYPEVRLIDPRLDEPVDVEWMTLEDPETGEVSRERVSKASGSIIPLPPQTSGTTEPSGDVKKDTSLDDAAKVTLEGGTIGEEINRMALVKLKVLEDWFVEELSKLYEKDKHLRDKLSAERKEYQFYTYQRALQILQARVEAEAPDLLPEVAAMRYQGGTAPPAMPDFTAEQEQYRMLRRAARFKLREDLKPPEVESLYDRKRRSTTQGTTTALYAEAKRRLDKTPMLSVARMYARRRARQKIRDQFPLSPSSWLQESLEIEAEAREQMELGNSHVHNRETTPGWKPRPERLRADQDAWGERFKHMPNVMEEMRSLGHGVPGEGMSSPPADSTPPGAAE